jgi:hypothetical protein
MRATVSYEGTKAWCLVEVVTPQAGPPTHNPVAIFNFDSDAERFQGQVFAEGLDGKLLSIDRDVRRMFAMLSERPA